MNDPTLGNWALGILGSLLVLGVPAFFMVLKSTKARLHARMDQEKTDADARMEKLESRIYDRVAMAEKMIDKYRDELGDDMHDLEKMTNSQAIQLTTLTTCHANIELTLVRIEAAMEKRWDVLAAKLESMAHGK
jgi:hypothetical protein